MENIEIYFESIKQVYDQIFDWEKERRNRPEPFRQKVTNFLVVSSIILFILSLIPIVPSIFIFLGGRFSWIIFGFHLNQATLWTYALAWLISSIITVLLIPLNIWLDSKINPPSKKAKEKAPQTLSSEQSTFIFVYQAYKELKIFFVSHIDQHIDKALTSLRRLRHSPVELSLGDELAFRSLPPEIRHREIERYRIVNGGRYRSVLNRSTLTRQISVAQEFIKTFEKYSWINIDDLTKARLQALISFQKKILIRLRKREDLPAVLSVLENLSKFLYAFLPEHKANMNKEELNALHAEGVNCLDAFVEDVHNLIDYPPERHPERIDHHDERLNFIQKIQLFYFRNVFFRFIVWLLLLLAVTTGLVYVATLKIANLDINIMVSTVIAASVTGATALAVIGAKPQKAVRKLQKKGVQKLHDVIDMEEDEAE